MQWWKIILPQSVLHVQSVCFLRIFSFLSLLYCCAELASSVTTQKNVHYATILCSPEKTTIWWKTRDKIEVRWYQCRGSNHKIKQARCCHSALYTLVIYRLINLTAKYLFLSQQTFNYSSTLWSNKETFNLNGGKTGFDAQETKLPSYWTTSFSKICLGMKIGQQPVKFIVINKQANSLYSLIADGQYRKTSLGRDKWKSLIGSNASLQYNCNKEGFNVVGGNPRQSKARIGIIGNNEKDCKSCNSRIGFGTGGYPDITNSCGNEAKWFPENVDKHIKAMGYVLVQ